MALTRRAGLSSRDTTQHLVLDDSDSLDDLLSILTHELNSMPASVLTLHHLLEERGLVLALFPTTSLQAQTNSRQEYAPTAYGVASLSSLSLSVASQLQ